MGIQNWSEDIILVDLPCEPDLQEELKAVTEIVCNRGDCDVIADFSSVDIVTGGTVTVAQTISEVGVFTITATPGRYLSDEALSEATATTAEIGRFIPAKFVVEIITPADTALFDDANASCGFNYSA